MVMIHIKKQSIKDNPTPIINNPFVKHALTKELFGCIVYSIASSLYRKKIYILDKAVVFFSKYTKLDKNDAKKPRRTSTFCRPRWTTSLPRFFKEFRLQLMPNMAGFRVTTSVIIPILILLSDSLSPASPLVHIATNHLKTTSFADNKNLLSILSNSRSSKAYLPTVPLNRSSYTSIGTQLSLLGNSDSPYKLSKV